MSPADPLFTQIDSSVAVEPRSWHRGLLDFPNPVNDYAARSTAGLVIVLAVVSIGIAELSWRLIEAPILARGRARH